MTIAPRMGWFINKFGLNTMITAGFIAYALAYADFLRIGPDSPYLWVILPSVALIGIAFPFSFPPANVLAVSDIAEEQHGIAAGVLQTGYQLGAAIVLATTTALMHSDTSQLSLDQYRTGLWLLLGISLATAVLSMIVPRIGKRTRGAGGSESSPDSYATPASRSPTQPTRSAGNQPATPENFYAAEQG